MSAQDLASSLLRAYVFWTVGLISCGTQVTLRTTRERPVTVAEGTNRLIDPYDAAGIVGAVVDVLAAPLPAAGHRPELWDGHAAQRLVAVIAGCATYRLPPDGT